MGRKKKNRDKAPEPAAAAPSGDISRHWVIGLILAVTFFTFLNSAWNRFAYDDNTQILKNKFILDFHNLPKALVTEAWFWRVEQDKDPVKQQRPTTPYYRPVFTVYLMVCAALFEDREQLVNTDTDMLGSSSDPNRYQGNPAPWHIASIFLHLVVVYFVFLILYRFSKNLWLSAAATLIFALHPMRSESVAWISGVTDLLLAAFLLPSFYLYMRYREDGKTKHLVWALALFLLAAFTKEPAISMPVMIGAYELFIIHQDKPIRERIRPAIVYSGMFFVICAVYFGMRFYSLGFFLNDLHYTHYPFSGVLMTIPTVVCKYLKLLLWPATLSLLHTTLLVRSPLDINFIIPALVVALLGFGLWRLRNSLVARFAMLWFLINLVPVLNLSAFGQEFMLQERYVYIPSIGFSLLIALALTRIPIENWIGTSRRAAQAAAVAVVCVALAGKTFAQNQVWKDDFTLYSHAEDVGEDIALTHFIMGHYYIKMRMIDKAIDELERCIEKDPTNLIAINNLTSVHLLRFESGKDRADLDRAIALCDQGLQINQDQPLLWDALGHAYAYDSDKRNYQFALKCFGRALKLTPENPFINLHTGATYLKMGDVGMATRYLEAARDLQPDLPDTYKFLAEIYVQKGDIRQAVDTLTRYLSLGPADVDLDREKKRLETLRAQLQSGSSQGSG
jgi:tetratricopeptide (TPR) repeat protein